MNFHFVMSLPAISFGDSAVVLNEKKEWDRGRFTIRLKEAWLCRCLPPE